MVFLRSLLSIVISLNLIKRKSRWFLCSCSWYQCKQLQPIFSLTNSSLPWSWLYMLRSTISFWIAPEIQSSSISPQIFLLGAMLIVDKSGEDDFCKQCQPYQRLLSLTILGLATGSYDCGHCINNSFVMVFRMIFRHRRKFLAEKLVDCMICV